MVVAVKTIAQGIAEWKDAWRRALAQRDEIITALVDRTTQQSSSLKEWQEALGQRDEALRIAYADLNRLELELHEIREAQGNDSNPPPAPQIMEVPSDRDIPHPPPLPPRGAGNGEERNGGS